jgi:hypothetical protein
MQCVQTRHGDALILRRPLQAEKWVTSVFGVLVTQSYKEVYMKRVKFEDLKGKERMLAMLAGAPKFIYVGDAPVSPSQMPKSRKKSKRKK